MKLVNREGGFTLIELLIVIVIIGILAGAVIAVINPAQQNRRAKHSVLLANTDKLCFALYACAAVQSTPFSACDTIAEIGATTPTEPDAATYAIAASSPNLTITGTLVDGGTTCTYTCSYNTTSGTSGNITAAADCMVQP